MALVSPPPSPEKSRPLINVVLIITVHHSGPLPPDPAEHGCAGASSGQWGRGQGEGREQADAAACGGQGRQPEYSPDDCCARARPGQEFARQVSVILVCFEPVEIIPKGPLEDQTSFSVPSLLGELSVSFEEAAILCNEGLHLHTSQTRATRAARLSCFPSCC